MKKLLSLLVGIVGICVGASSTLHASRINEGQIDATPLIIVCEDTLYDTTLEDEREFSETMVSYSVHVNVQGQITEVLKDLNGDVKAPMPYTREIGYVEVFEKGSIVAGVEKVDRPIPHIMFVENYEIKDGVLHIPNHADYDLVPPSSEAAIRTYLKEQQQTTPLIISCVEDISDVSVETEGSGKGHYSGKVHVEGKIARVYKDTTGTVSTSMPTVREESFGWEFPKRPYEGRKKHTSAREKILNIKKFEIKDGVLHIQEYNRVWDDSFFEEPKAESKTTVKQG